MTHRKAWFYPSYYEELKKFRKEKKITEEKMIKLIAENLALYNQPLRLLENEEKILVNIKGEVKDFKEIERVTSSSLIDVILQYYMYNFMQVHKNDTFRKTGLTISVYFTNQEVEKLRDKAGVKGIAYYIKQEVLK